MATRTWRANSSGALTLVSDWGGVASETYVDGRDSGDDALRTVSYTFPGWTGGSPSDALVVDVGVSSSPSGPWQHHRFVTGAVGTGTVRAETWTISYYLFNGLWTEDWEDYAEFIYGVPGVPANIDGITDYWPGSVSVLSASRGESGYRVPNGVPQPLRATPRVPLPSEEATPPAPAEEPAISPPPAEGEPVGDAPPAEGPPAGSVPDEEPEPPAPEPSPEPPPEPPPDPPPSGEITTTG